MVVGNFWVATRLIILLIGYMVMGFLLGFFHVAPLIWLWTILSIVYLSWSGTGAIAMVIFLILMIVALSIIVITGENWLENFALVEEKAWFQPLTNFLDSIQNAYFKPTIVIFIWVISFVIIWLFSTALAFYHGFTKNRLEDHFKSQFWLFALLSIIALIGLKIGQILA